MISVPAHFANKKCEDLKNIRLTFFKFKSIPTHTSLTRGINRQLYCTGVIIYDKTRQVFFVSVDKQRFLGFEMTSS